jgi:hypothetical protein
MELEIHDQESELLDLEKKAIEHHEPKKVIDDIKTLEKEAGEVENKQDALIDDLKDSLGFLDSTEANDIESMSLEEIISEDKDVLREQKEQMQNLKDVYDDLTDKGERTKVKEEFDEEKKLAVQEQTIIQKEEALLKSEEKVNKGKGSIAQVIKDEQEISKLDLDLFEAESIEALHENVTMERLEDAHKDNKKLVADANEVEHDSENLEFDMEVSKSDEDVLFLDDKAAEKKNGHKFGGEIGDEHEQASKAEHKFEEDQEHLIEVHGVEETVEAQVQKPCD